MIETKQAIVNNLNIQYYCAGVGDTTIILLHGAGADSAMMSWREVLSLLAGEGYRVIAPDLPGYGGSDRIDGDYSLPFYAQTIKAFIEGLDCGPVVLCGLSLGGGITLKAALDYPHMLKAIIPVDAWGLFDKLPWHRLTHWFVNSSFNRNLYGWTGQYRWMIRWSLETNLIGDKSKVTEELVDETIAAMRQPDAGEPFRSFQLCELTKSGIVTKLFDRLEEITLPTLLIHGSKDASVPLAGAIAAQKRMPTAALHVMEGCKHWPQKERPEEFIRAVANFLQR
jgi:pimeloyl-ACP methyl ester carboxylesterase